MTKVSFCDLTWGSCPQVSLFIPVIMSNTASLPNMNTMRIMFIPIPSYYLGRGLGMTPATACILVRAVAA